MTGQSIAGRVIALLAALLWALLPFCTAGAEPASSSQWVAVPYCAVQAGDASDGGRQPPLHQTRWLYFASASALLWSAGTAPALPTRRLLLSFALPRAVPPLPSGGRPHGQVAGPALPSVRAPPLDSLLPA